MAKIISVARKSVGAEIGIRKGDELVAFDGVSFVDILDYYFYDQEERFTMTISRKNKEHVIEIDKEQDESLGLELADMEIAPIRCKNKCKFCFVDQLPKGMRDTLYVKDDDYRLSFISGNYITLTNVGEVEMSRIIKLRLSPMYISVHATADDVKVNLVSNPESRNTLSKMRRLSAAGIIMHAQIVMCAGINDGEVLAKSLADLATLAPNLRSVAIVPVGLSGHRQGLYPLEPITRDIARKAINIIDNANKVAGKTYCYASDEMYLRAEVELPSYEEYGDFEQIENGVGLVRMFEHEVKEEVASIAPNSTKIGVTCITGVSFADSLTKNIEIIKTKLTGLDVDVAVVNNDFFGRSITVAGLITAGDIVSQLRGKTQANVIIPSNMLREFTDTFLDGMTVPQLEEKLCATIHVSGNGGELAKILDSLVK